MKTFGMIKVGDIFYDGPPIVGTKVKFLEEKQSYTIRATNRFYAVCTKPFNAKKTVFYTIIDWHHQIRGAENLIFSCGAETDEQCIEMLERLTAGDSNLSHRNWCELNIEKITSPSLPVKLINKE